MDARLHVVGAVAAGLQRVDAHHLRTREAKAQRFLGVAALELDLARGRGHETEMLLGKLNA